MAALSTRESDANARTIAVERRSFDGIMMAFHWATVVIVLGLLTTALMHAQLHDAETRVLLLRIHRSLGVTVWLVTAARLLWRTTQAELPPFPVEMTRLHRAFVTMGEYCLYALLVIQPMTGFAATVARGRAFPLFWWEVQPLMPRYPALEDALFLAHRVGAWALIILITGHAAAALIHHFVLRDEVLARMVPVAAIRRRLRDVSPEAGEVQVSLDG